MDREIKDPAEIDKKIAELTQRYETTSMSKEDERNLSRRLDILKKSKPLAEKLTEIQPKLD